MPLNTPPSGPAPLPNAPQIPGNFPVPPAAPIARQKNQRPLLPHQVLGMRAHGPLGDQILQRAFPIGCIYISTVATNPGDDTIFGFGTWVAFGAGRTLIGVGTSDQAFTAGATGGSSTKNLSHQHETDVGFDSGSFYGNANSLGIPVDGSTVLTATNRISSGASEAANSAVRVANTAYAGSSSQDVLNPYIVVYFWQRTA